MPKPLCNCRAGLLFGVFFLPSMLIQPYPFICLNNISVAFVSLSSQVKVHLKKLVKQKYLNNNQNV